jgi:hypothetical protein
LEASRLTWLDEEEEGVAAELQGVTGELRVAWSGEPVRRPELGFRR